MMTPLYSLMIKAADGEITARCWEDDEGVQNIAVALRGKRACVYAESLPLPMRKYLSDSVKLKTIICDLIGMSDIELVIRPMMSVTITERGTWKIEHPSVGTEITTAHDQFANRLVPINRPVRPKRAANFLRREKRHAS